MRVIHEIQSQQSLFNHHYPILLNTMNDSPKGRRQLLVVHDGELFLRSLDTPSTTTTAFRLLAGSLHYFRIPPAYWEDRIIKCKQLGCNTVETYVAWNIHEPEENQWTFEGFADLVQFITLVQKHNLFMIVRYSPYICAEWDNGGMPYWLLRDKNVRLRTRDPKFWSYCQRFYRVITEKLRPYFSTAAQDGGPIIAGQLENEYGCTQNDSQYLQQHYHFLTEELKVDIPLLNGVWAEERFLNAGHCEGTITALNFNNEAKQKFEWLKEQIPQAPRICTEFWCGWFSAWGGHRYKPRESPEVVAERFEELLEAKAHAILYLFHGGTNFGMRNGSNIRADYCQWTITSYDYEAPLNESGQITEYYERLQKVANKHGFATDYKYCAQRQSTGANSFVVENSDAVTQCTQSITIKNKRLHVQQFPLPVPPPISYPTIQITEQAYLLEQIEFIGSDSTIACPYPLTMEECHQDYGYLLYRTHITGPSVPVDSAEEGGTDTLTINELRDRAHIYLDGTYLETLERTAGRCVIQTQKKFQVPKEGLQLDILVENQGRCNFPPFSQDHKGITENVFLGDCFVLSNWEHYPIWFSKKQLENIEWSPIIAEDQIDDAITRTTTNNKTNKPTFYKAHWDLSAYSVQPFLRDTYIRLPQFHKGVVIINGFNLGRYWNIGPQLSLYCPAPLLVAGMNEIIIFDEEGGVGQDGSGLEIEFIDHLVMKT